MRCVHNSLCCKSSGQSWKALPSVKNFWSFDGNNSTRPSTFYQSRPAPKQFWVNSNGENNPALPHAVFDRDVASVNKKSRANRPCWYFPSHDQKFVTESIQERFMLVQHLSSHNTMRLQFIVKVRSVPRKAHAYITYFGIWAARKGKGLDVFSTSTCRHGTYSCEFTRAAWCIHMYLARLCTFDEKGEFALPCRQFQKGSSSFIMNQKSLYMVTSIAAMARSIHSRSPYFLISDCIIDTAPDL